MGTAVLASPAIALPLSADSPTPPVPPTPSALVRTYQPAILPAWIAQLPGTDASGSGAGAEGRFLLQGQPLNLFSAQRITYTGDCPGTGQNSLQGVSFLAAIPPAPYQRILIRNLSTGGFTDREYDERRAGAEAFSIALGQGQRGSHLTVAPGQNTFSYEVRNRRENRSLASGVASLEVAVNDVRQFRGFSEIREEKYCTGKRYGSPSRLQDCPDGLVTVERTGVCPGGNNRVLSLETVRLGPGGNTRPGW